MTIAELLASETFALLFHHEYCEQSMRQNREYAYTMGEPTFTIEASDGRVTTGRFLGQAEVEGGPHGATSGAFTLTLPDGLDAGDARAVLDNATLSVRIETAPLQPIQRV